MKWSSAGLARSGWEEKLKKQAQKEKKTELVKILDKAGLLATELITNATNKKVNPHTRLKAIEMIYDRIEGKPSQTAKLEGSKENPINFDTKIEIKLIE